MSMKSEIEKLLLPVPRVRKGTKSKSSKIHEDKRKKKKEKYKNKPE